MRQKLCLHLSFLPASNEGGRFPNVQKLRKQANMDALSEREKEAILSEIQLIKKALSGDKDDSDESHGLSSEENSDGPYGNCFMTHIRPTAG